MNGLCGKSCDFCNSKTAGRCSGCTEGMNRGMERCEVTGCAASRRINNCAFCTGYHECNLRKAAVNGNSPVGNNGGSDATMVIQKNTDYNKIGNVFFVVFWINIINLLTNFVQTLAERLMNPISFYYSRLPHIIIIVSICSLIGTLICYLILSKYSRKYVAGLIIVFISVALSVLIYLRDIGLIYFHVDQLITSYGTLILSCVSSILFMFGNSDITEDVNFDISDSWRSFWTQYIKPVALLVASVILAIIGSRLSAVAITISVCLIASFIWLLVVSFRYLKLLWYTAKLLKAT